MLLAQDGQGLVFYPKHQVASLTPAFPQRWRVVFQDGTVAYHPHPLPPGPWIPLNDAWVIPQHLSRHGDCLQDPAGFPFPLADLPPVPPPVEPPGHPDLPCPPQRIYALDDKNWHTDDGPIPSRLPLAQASQLHPDLRLAKKNLYFNSRRLRRITFDVTRRIILNYDNGQTHSLQKTNQPILRHSLGLPNLRHLEAFAPGLYRFFLREYPFELARTEAHILKPHFTHADDLMVNVMWQNLFYQQRGLKKGYGKDHRGFCYMPISTTLERVGFMTRVVDPRSIISDPIYARFERLLAQYIRDDQFFDYEEFGFEDQTQPFRLIGSRQPHVILLCEKDSVADFCREQASQRGLSFFLAGGVPSLLASEYFAKALARVYSGPVIIIALVDWDPGGYFVAQSLVHQLARYNFTAAQPAFLMHPDVFSAEELELFARKLKPKSAQEASRIRNWVDRTGGIGNEARGIYVNCLFPIERLVPQLERLLCGG